MAMDALIWPEVILTSLFLAVVAERSSPKYIMPSLTLGHYATTTYRNGLPLLIVVGFM